MPEIIEEHNVESNPQGLRINEYLVGKLESLNTRKSIKKALTAQRFMIDGKAVRSSLIPSEGMKIQLLEDRKKDQKIYEAKIEVVFQDEFLAIVNKPAGMISSGNKLKTLQNSLPFNIKKSIEKDALDYPMIVHRLDSGTSGLVLVAKTRSSLVKLNRYFQEKKIKKEYQAIVHGKVSANGEIDLSIENKEALSKYATLRSQESSAFGHLSWVKLEPLTGRTHQLRIHMESIDHPILGDPLYGNTDKKLKGKGIFLCSTALSFTHPNKGSELKIEIQAPKKFDDYWNWTTKRWNLELNK